MKNRYDEVMKNIEVTEDMRDRVLNNINSMDWNKTSGNTVPFSSYRKYLSIAACFAVLAVGAAVFHNMNGFTRDPSQQVIPDIVEYSDAKKLSETLGFPVKEIQNVPFEVESTIFTALWGDLAEIEYTGINNSVYFRMAPGNDDVSGDSSEYETVKDVTVTGFNVTLKGDKNSYLLALWKTDGYSYSIQFTEGVSEKEILDTVQSVN